ncbi:unnamed protein product [Cylicocyclus nassatus]|uniref:Uncharacterized protein n=1 Tax=Cylicocyclus nassatus TaxID=53992 RepID=A0AA36H413_CYLNA|nr:unnamed protein product [Cylicocyclus nassatus]
MSSSGGLYKRSLLVTFILDIHTTTGHSYPAATKRLHSSCPETTYEENYNIYTCQLLDPQEYYSTCAGVCPRKFRPWLDYGILALFSLCGVCLPRSVTLVPADGTPGSITPVIKVLVNDSRGCRRIYIICNTPAGYTKSNMVMNEQTDYPLVGKNVRALATCFKASWIGDLHPYYNFSIE